MCDSLRGGAYYGASVHLSFAMIFLVGFIIDCAGIAEVWHNPHATYLTLILAFMYISLFLVFGILVFRGIEQESVKILRGTVVGFLVLQFSAFFIYLGILVLLSRKQNAVVDAANNKSLEVEMGSGNDSLSFPSTTEAVLLETQIEAPTDLNSTIEVILNVNSMEEDYSPIITVLQIIGLIFGIIATIIYVVVLIVYIRNIGSEPRGRRN